MKLKYLCPSISGISLAIILLLASCKSDTVPTIVTSPTITATNIAIPQQTLELSATASPSSAVTVTVMVEMTPDDIPDFTTPTTTVSETVTLPLSLGTPTGIMTTLTPLPTLEGATLELAVAELLDNPMNCDVPCWWGAVPNETTGAEIQQFLSLYQFTFHERYDNQILDFIEVWIGYDKDRNYVDFRVMYSFDNDVLKGVFAEQSPRLYNILREYGQPDEVWIETMGFEREGDLPVRLNLVYLQQGMAVGYVVDGKIQNDLVTGCFTDEETGLLQLNTPSSSTNYRDFRGIFEVDRSYLPLEEATNLTIEDFMQRFSDPTQPQCIETPTELWK